MKIARGSGELAIAADNIGEKGSGISPGTGVHAHAQRHEHPGGQLSAGVEGACEAAISTVAAAMVVSFARSTSGSPHDSGMQISTAMPSTRRIPAGRGRMLLTAGPHQLRAHVRRGPGSENMTRAPLHAGSTRH